MIEKVRKFYEMKPIFFDCDAILLFYIRHKKRMVGTRSKRRRRRRERNKKKRGKVKYSYNFVYFILHYELRETLLVFFYFVYINSRFYKR